MTVVDRIIGFALGLVIVGIFAGGFWAFTAAMIIVHKSIDQHTLKIILSVLCMLPVAYVIGTGYIANKKDMKKPQK